MGSSKQDSNPGKKLSLLLDGGANPSKCYVNVDVTGTVNSS